MTRSRDKRRKAIRKTNEFNRKLVKAAVKDKHGVTLSDKEAAALLRGAKNEL
jgi:hypothetical protein